MKANKVLERKISDRDKRIVKLEKEIMVQKDMILALVKSLQAKANDDNCGYDIKGNHLIFHS